jgi:hypothetical protein
MFPSIPSNTKKIIYANWREIFLRNRAVFSILFASKIQNMKEMASMDSKEQYIKSLALVDDLYCVIVQDGVRYVCHSKKTSHNSWKLSATNCIDSFWETELDYLDVVRHVSF